VKKVLIVDDSETIRQQLSRALSDAGFMVVEASDGLDGLERVARHDDLSLIILDVNMPRLNGLDMLDQLKERPEAAHVPVLILTTEAQQALIERAKRSGARGWIIKPVKLDLLVQAVTKLAN
jgi:two-component system, chemotaxis family, chemotaxis protein CheY